MSQSSQMNPQIIAFGGAKGGVGRSVICALTALSLADQGKKVVVIDLDLGSANLHTLLGIMQPKKSLEQWILGQEDRLEVICSPTDKKNLTLISGAASIFNPSDFAPSQYERLVRESLMLEVDFVLIDLGAGIHPHTLDMFNIASRSFIITSPEPTSIQNTYAFLKAALIRRVEVSLKHRPWLKKILKRTALTKGAARITSLGEMLDMLRELDVEVNRQVKAQFMSLKAYLIINRAVGDDEEQVVETLRGICEKLLQFPLEHTLTIPEDKGIQNAIRKLTAFHQLNEDLSIKKVINAWVGEWLISQPYAPLQEECLMMIGTPSFLSQNISESNTQTNLSLMGITGIQPSVQLPMTSTFDSHVGIPLSQVDLSLASDVSQTDLNAHLAQAYPNPSHLAQAHPSDAYREPVVFSDMDGEVYDSQVDSYIEPEPINVISMEDPPRHEVTAIEEEVRTSLGWFHLKTSDLAPFRPAIQTSVYVDGHREVFFEESYEGVYEGGGKGTQIEKRVERIHHESIKSLQKGGIPMWWEAHLNDQQASENQNDFPLVARESEGYFGQR
jgi:flagellar biosynthesis protein FlhG